jgi:hypothetical protein
MIWRYVPFGSSNFEGEEEFKFMEKLKAKRAAKKAENYEDQE